MSETKRICPVCEVEYTSWIEHECKEPLPTDELERLIENCNKCLDTEDPRMWDAPAAIMVIKLLAERVIACEGNDKMTSEILAGHVNSINNLESRLEKLEDELCGVL